MPSHLRLQTTFAEPFTAETTRSHCFSSPPAKKQKMSLTQTYYIAASARSKLGKEACRPDHDLRLLVGHANLLDSLMLELAEAEKKQEEWFNNTVRRASKADERRHVQWADTIAEVDEEEDDSDSDSDFYDEEGDFDMIAPPRRTIPAPVQITLSELEEEDDEEIYEDMEDDEEHSLVRTSSHSAQSPPELVHDLDDSDDESAPASPPQPSMEFTEKERMLTTSYYSSKSEQPAFLQEDYFIRESSAPLIAQTC